MSSPPPSRICWSLLVQNQKELFTERRTGGGWGCGEEEDEVVTGGGKIVGLGPRRDEASLSSTALSVRKTRHWGSIHSVPLPPCSVQGCCLSGSPSQPRTRCSVVIAALLPAPSAGPPHASPAHPQPKVLQGAERIASRVSAGASWAPSWGSVPRWPGHDWHRRLLALSLPLTPFAYFTPSLKSLSTQLSCAFTGAWPQGCRVTWNSSCCQVSLASSSVSWLQGISKSQVLRKDFSTENAPLIPVPPSLPPISWLQLQPAGKVLPDKSNITLHKTKFMLQMWACNLHMICVYYNVLIRKHYVNVCKCKPRS